MSDANHGWSLDDERLLDRLVDGELSNAERQRFLNRLDTEPEGWRHCALAFLEAQCWREVLAPVAGTTGQPAGAPGLRTVLPIQKAIQGAENSRARRLLPIAVRAAAVLLAFGLGLSVGGARRTEATRTDMAAGTSLGSGPEIQQDRSSPALPRPGESNASPSSEIPLTEVSESESAWLAQLPLAVPPSLQRKWEQRGYRVETRRQLVSGSLADGRRVAIPVDQVKLHYVGQPVY